MEFRRKDFHHAATKAEGREEVVCPPPLPNFPMKKHIKKFIILTMKNASNIFFIFFLISFVFIINTQAQAIDPPPKCYRFNNEAVPYGYYRHHWRQTGYGQRTQIRNIEEAISLVQEFYKTMKVTIVPVKENMRFYKIEVLDENKNILDIVVVDKLSGRIRSVY